MNSKIKQSVALLISLMLVGTLYGCNNTTETPTNTSSAIEESSTKVEEPSVASRERMGRATDELVVSMGSYIPHDFDPLKSFGSHNEARITHSTLLRRTPDLDMIGDYAKSYEVSDDGLAWTFSLKDGFYFSNGDKVTPEDVKFSYELIKEDGKYWDLSFIKDIEIIDDNTIKFVLNEPRSSFTQQLSEIAIIPKDVYDENYPKNPIGSGPYMVTEYNPDEQAIFELNPYYYGDKPHFKKWTWVLLDENTALAALESGQVDLIYSIPEFADMEVEGCKLFDIETNDVRGISLPYQKPNVLTSPDGYPVGNEITSENILRQAMNIAVDRQKVVDVVLNGHGKPAFSVIDGAPWWNEETAIEDGRVEEAKQMLDEAGWIEGSDGVREKDGKKAHFKLYYATDDALRTNTAIEAANQIKDIGIDVELVGSNWDEMATLAHQEALLYGGGKLHPNEFYAVHHLDSSGHGWSNGVFYNNPKVTEYIEKAMSAISQEEANKYWKLAQWDGETGASVLGDIANVWLIRWNHSYLGDKHINIGDQGIHAHGHEWGLLHNIEDWTWEE